MEERRPYRPIDDTAQVIDTYKELGVFLIASTTNRGAVGLALKALCRSLSNHRSIFRNKEKITNHENTDQNRFMRTHHRHNQMYANYDITNWSSLSLGESAMEIFFILTDREKH